MLEHVCGDSCCDQLMISPAHPSILALLTSLALLDCSKLWLHHLCCYTGCSAAPIWLPEPRPSHWLGHALRWSMAF
jgi:hypothetical protein